VKDHNPDILSKNAHRAFDEHGDMVFRLAVMRTRNQSDAEDIVQDVFLRYIKSAPSTMDTEHEKAWLIRVAINCTKSLATSAWKQRATSLTSEIADSRSNVFESAVESSAVYEAVSQLPDNYRTVIHLFYFEGYKTAEIADLLSANDATIRSWLHRAREVLRKTIEIDDEEE
jgi:RNA polymerase sigma-70 factor (ECF subfamily)